MHVRESPHQPQEEVGYARPHLASALPPCHAKVGKAPLRSARALRFGRLRSRTCAALRIDRVITQHTRASSRSQGPVTARSAIGCERAIACRWSRVSACGRVHARQSNAGIRARILLPHCRPAMLKAAGRPCALHARALRFGSAESSHSTHARLAGASDPAQPAGPP